MDTTDYETRQLNEFLQYTGLTEDQLWKWMIKKRYNLPDPKHLHLSYNQCEIYKWRQDDVPEFVSKPFDTLRIHEKLMAEIHNTDRNTTVNPTQVVSTYNIITNLGLNEMGKRSTGQVSTTNLWYLFGDGNTSEVVGDTDLVNQVASKSFASAGTRTVLTATRTEKYAMPLTDGDYTGDIDEAGLATGNNPPTDILITRFTLPATVTVSSGDLINAITTIQHKNGTVS